MTKSQKNTFKALTEHKKSTVNIRTNTSIGNEYNRYQRQQRSKTTQNISQPQCSKKFHSQQKMMVGWLVTEV